jgi:hypothetical protein
MNIYENGISPRKRTNTPPRKADPKEILNDQSLSALVKMIKNGPTTAKEVLYDTDKNIIGVLQRDNTPFFFTDKQSKDFTKIYKGKK